MPTGLGSVLPTKTRTSPNVARQGYREHIVLHRPGAPLPLPTVAVAPPLSMLVTGTIMSGLMTGPLL